MKKTIRDELSRKRRTGSGVALAAWLFFAVSLFTPKADQNMAPLALIPFIVFMAAALYLMFGSRCPSCHGNLSYTLMWPSSFWNIPSAIKFCPFCGIELDKDVNEVRSSRPNGK